jgi:hypothetical protein
MSSAAFDSGNGSDPGAEMEIYQLNKITAAQVRKFLALVGVRPRPPQAARLFLSITPSDNTVLGPLRAGAEWNVKNTSLRTSKAVR